MVLPRTSFVERGQHRDAATRVAPEVVPLISTDPRARQRDRRRMALIFDSYGRVLNVGMVEEVCADERTIEGPVVLSVGC